MNLATNALPTTLKFTVPGEPVPKGRAEFFPVRVKKKNKQGRLETITIMKPVTPDATRAYEAKIKLLAQVAVNQARWLPHPDDRFSIVIRVFRKHEGAGGDGDNYFKAAADAMNKVVYPDDRRARGGAWTIFPSSNPRMEIEVHRYPKGSRPGAGG